MSTIDKVHSDRPAVVEDILQKMGQEQAANAATSPELYVFVKDGITQGYIGLSRNDRRANGGVYILCMGVYPEFQRQGVGSSLLAFATRLSDNGLTSGDVRKDNLPARDFFYSQHEGTEEYSGDQLPLPTNIEETNYVENGNHPEITVTLYGTPRK